MPLDAETFQNKVMELRGSMPSDPAKLQGQENLTKMLGFDPSVEGGFNEVATEQSKKMLLWAVMRDDVVTPVFGMLAVAYLIGKDDGLNERNEDAPAEENDPVST